MNSKVLSGALLSLAKNSKDTVGVVKNFVEFLESHHLQDLLPEILRHLERKELEEKKEDTVFIKTSHDVSERSIKEIIKSLSLPNDSVEVTVDKDLIGGFLVKHKGVVYEASLRNHLRNLRTQIEK